MTPKEKTQFFELRARLKRMQSDLVDKDQVIEEKDKEIKRMYASQNRLRDELVKALNNRDKLYKEFQTYKKNSFTLPEPNENTKGEDLFKMMIYANKALGIL